MVLQQIFEVGLTINGEKNLDKETPSRLLSDPPDGTIKMSAKV